MFASPPFAWAGVNVFYWAVCVTNKRRHMHIFKSGLVTRAVGSGHWLAIAVLS